MDLGSTPNWDNLKLTIKYQTNKGIIYFIYITMILLNMLIFFNRRDEKDDKRCGTHWLFNLMFHILFSAMIVGVLYMIYIALKVYNIL